ncbi:regulator of G-protein signaling 9-like [Acanthaster planci]|uniref:Regulator of G-protein signaling 9-like n=1 Tax=Acanthaster planci TaxID=133434 RepID=A0A8B7YVV7_ACAPL|nr:regulator of G-protein signaling 9-like [Acanthaster planci]
MMELDQSAAPKQLVFAKIEKIIRDMQHHERGIKTRSQKVFLTSIPCAFTGSELIEWIMDKLHVHNTIEAVHIGNLICQYGYIFPVQDMKVVVLKDDSALYRFQSPYFWPSQSNLDPDNTDYAIYLAKRSMRNKQQHGLEEFETTAFNKLQRMLRHKWDFVLVQAQEQLRLAKHRKKADRLVVDSQEKAYWKTHRPPPGQINSLEKDIRRSYRPFALVQSKKRTVEDLKKEVAYLQRRLAKAKITTHKAVEGMVRRCNRYAEHDPFLAGAQPSNPWITDDTTMWTLNTMLVDTPTERRVRRWCISLRELLRDATGRHEFEMFLKKEYSQENIRFWQACEQLKYAPQSSVPEQVHEIYREFLAPGAPCEINVDGRTVEMTQLALRKPNRFAFEAAQHHIFLLMKKDSYPRFLRSNEFKKLLTNAMHTNIKKKFFPFGRNLMRTAKVTPDATPMSLRRRGSFGDEEGEGQSIGETGMVHSLSASNLHDYEMTKIYSDAQNGHSTEENGIKQTKQPMRFSSLQPIHSAVLVRNSSLTRLELASCNGQAQRPGSGDRDSTSHFTTTTFTVSSNSHTNTNNSTCQLFTVPICNLPTKKSLITPWEEDGS